MKKTRQSSASVHAIRVVWDLLCGSFLGCIRERVPEAAASVAYFALFALFPLLILLISAASFVLEPPQARDQVLSVILQVMPAVSHKLISGNIDRILQNRGTMSMLGVIGLVWATYGVFGVLTANLSRSWPAAQSRNVLRSRGVALALVLGLFVLVFALLFIQMSLNALAEQEHVLGIQVPISSAVRYASQALVYIFSFAALLFMYRFVPNTTVRWPEAAGGASFAFVLAHLSARVLGWFMGAGLARYNLVYGSLASLVLLLFWIYAVGFVVLWGSHVSAAVARVSRIGDPS